MEEYRVMSEVYEENEISSGTIWKGNPNCLEIVQ